MKETWGLCKECYGTVPAEVGGGIIVKHCPTHGVQFANQDPDPKFVDWVRDQPYYEAPRLGMTAITVTNRCNVRCPGCYHHPDSSTDDSMLDVIKVAENATKPVIGLMGAEPTMREDLPQLIHAIRTIYKKGAVIYTNGIRLENKDYLEELGRFGLGRVCLSLHLPNYIGQKAYESKLRALKNLEKSRVQLDHIAFSLKDMDDVDDCLSVIMTLNYDNIIERYVRIRAPSSIGGERNSPVPLSVLRDEVFASCSRMGLKVEIAPFTNHMYAVMLLIEGRRVMLVRWPTVEEIDLEEAQAGPVKALFVPEIGEKQILHQVLMVDRLRSGGALPPKPPANCPRHL